MGFKVAWRRLWSSSPKEHCLKEYLGSLSSGTGAQEPAITKVLQANVSFWNMPMSKIYCESGILGVWLWSHMLHTRAPFKKFLETSWWEYCWNFMDKKCSAHCEVAINQYSRSLSSWIWNNRNAIKRGLLLWLDIPEIFMTSFHCINVGVTAKDGIKLNPLPSILIHFIEDDFFVVNKLLDMDTHSLLKFFFLEEEEDGGCLRIERMMFIPNLWIIFNLRIICNWKNWNPPIVGNGVQQLDHWKNHSICFTWKGHPSSFLSLNFSLH